MPRKPKPKPTRKPKLDQKSIAILSATSKLLREAYEALRQLEGTRDKDLMFLYQRVYNAWFDVEAARRKKLGMASLIPLQPSGVRHADIRLKDPLQIARERESKKENKDE